MRKVVYAEKRAFASRTYLKEALSNLKISVYKHMPVIADGLAALCAVERNIRELHAAFFEIIPCFIREDIRVMRVEQRLAVFLDEVDIGMHRAVICAQCRYGIALDFCRIIRLYKTVIYRITAGFRDIQEKCADVLGVVLVDIFGAVDCECGSTVDMGKARAAVCHLREIAVILVNMGYQQGGNIRKIDSVAKLVHI